MLHFVLHNFFFKACALHFRDVFIPLWGESKSPQTPVNTGVKRKRPVNTGLSENIAFGAGEGTRTLTVSHLILSQTRLPFRHTGLADLL